jgi:hypothetical protein
MFNLTEIIRAAQGGQALDHLARQFGLSQQQARDAVAALLPAYSLGLQRQTRSPGSLSALFGQMADAAHIPAFDQAGAAFAGQTKQQGADLLDMLFGSPAVSRQVANQAAAVSGVNPALLLQMMPVLAAILMGGMSKLSGAAPGQDGSLADLFNQLLGSLASQPPRAGPAADGPAGFGGLLSQILGAGGSPATSLGGASPTASHPMGDLLRQIWDPGAPTGPQALAPGGLAGGDGMTSNPLGPVWAAVLAGAGLTGIPAAPTQSAGDLNLEAFQALFQTGCEVQQSYISNLQDLLQAAQKPAGGSA